MASRKCTCCNEKYNYCPSCGNDRLKPTYLSVFCSESCKDLWTTLSKFSMGMLTKPEAVEIINSLNLKDKSKYVASVQRGMAEILKKESKLKKTQSLIASKVVVEKSIENISVEETQPSESHEVVNKIEEE